MYKNSKTFFKHPITPFITANPHSPEENLLGYKQTNKLVTFGPGNPS